MPFSLTPLKPQKQMNWRKAMSYVSPESIKDLDRFLDNLPLRSGLNNIIAASVIWAIAGASLLFVYTRSVNIQELQKELTQAEALRPTVPLLTYTPVATEKIGPHVDKIKTVYPMLQIVQTGSDIKVIAKSTRDYALWRAAIDDIGFGGSDWNVKIKDFCAGRDCKNGPLLANLSVQQVNISLPAPKTQQDDEKGTPNE
ncbi:MAG: hypothetical protein JWM96_1232 [Alphaproteobacteria bacterium]|nr:hypothetical protein [Alphaproteobacteria bacterium]